MTDTEARTVLRAVAGYEWPVTAAETARMTGLSRQTTAGMMAELARQGLLSRARQESRSSYTVTETGRAELEQNKTTVLAVEVDDRLAAEVMAYLQSVNGVEMVYEHGNGCCCKNCPWRGNHG